MTSPGARLWMQAAVAALALAPAENVAQDQAEGYTVRNLLPVVTN